MAALSPTNTAKRHVLGDLVLKHYNISGTNGDTLTVPQLNISTFSFTPTTNTAVGVTVSGSVFTFVTGGAFAGVLNVFSREG